MQQSSEVVTLVGHFARVKQSATERLVGQMDGEECLPTERTNAVVEMQLSSAAWATTKQRDSAYRSRRVTMPSAGSGGCWSSSTQRRVLAVKRHGPSSGEVQPRQAAGGDDGVMTHRWRVVWKISV